MHLVHPRAKDLAHFAVGLELPKEKKEAIMRHLLFCVECSSKVEAHASYAETHRRKDKSRNRFGI